MSTLTPITPNTVPPDASRCPLCGGDNRCAVEMARASGQPAGPCWCMSICGDADWLARLPVQAQGQACLCARCLERAAKPRAAAC